MSNPTDPPEWAARNKGKAQEAFNQAAQGARVPEPRKPEPAQRLEMPGPGGHAVRQQEAERAAIARAKQLQAAKGRENEQQIEKGRTAAVDQAKEMGQGNKNKDALARANKLAKEFNNAAKYKEHER